MILLARKIVFLFQKIHLYTGELRVHNNDITGRVHDSLCSIRNETGGPLYWLTADCQPPASGGLPQVECHCCTECYDYGCPGPAVECLTPQDNCILSNTSACANDMWTCVEVFKTCDLDGYVCKSWRYNPKAVSS
jgi:hypothetical protein